MHPASFTIRCGLLLGLLLMALPGCRPTYPKCKSDGHCADRGEVCVDGTCRECSTDEQCREGYSCRDNACVADECRVDADCPEAGRCVDGRCEPQCREDRECATGERCENNRCVSGCRTDADCPEGERCQSGQCVAPTGQLGSARQLADCTLERVHFAFNEFALAEETRAVLERNAECISFRGAPVIIEGHCDERGTEEYNLVLGEKRANAVKRYLTGLGVRENLLRTVSYGEERPLDSRRTDEGWSRNRRAELRFR